ncbi:MAG: CoA transferase [Alphaproteobacteria bacterium]|nr:CoA transferase [Alphaproteobacteria bacterium]
MDVLQGLRVVEFEGLGPAPFCGMLLADLGADVILIERPDADRAGPAAIYRRGKRSITLDLKTDVGCKAALRILEKAEALIEGLRPGVMERLGLGPDEVRAVNPKIVYGRLTGWGQTGPLAPAAGHDINYVSLSGAAWYAGEAGTAPTPPPTLVGDIGGGALYLAVGILSGVLRARQTGEGTVVDAAIVDGAAHMTNLLLSLRAAGGLPERRGESMLDGAPFYGVYQCADGAWISVGPLEPKFYTLMMERVGLMGIPHFAVQYDKSAWPRARAQLAQIFAEKPRDYWVKQLEGTDVCFAPVLSPSEAAHHPHMAARRVYREQGGVLQAVAAPRFDGEIPPAPRSIPPRGAHTREVLKEAGLTDEEIDALR